MSPGTPCRVAPPAPPRPRGRRDPAGGEKVAPRSWVTWAARFRPRGRCWRKSEPGAGRKWGGGGGGGTERDHGGGGAGTAGPGGGVRGIRGRGGTGTGRERGRGGHMGSGIRPEPSRVCPQDPGPGPGPSPAAESPAELSPPGLEGDTGSVGGVLGCGRSRTREVPRRFECPWVCGGLGGLCPGALGSWGLGVGCPRVWGAPGFGVPGGSPRVGCPRVWGVLSPRGGVPQGLACPGIWGGPGFGVSPRFWQAPHAARPQGSPTAVLTPPS